MQARWLVHKHMADRVMLTGATTLGIGVLWRAVPWVTRMLQMSRFDKYLPQGLRPCHPRYG